MIKQTIIFINILYTLLQSCYHPVTILLPSCHNPVTIPSQSCYHPVTIMLPSCHNHVTILLQSCCHPVTIMLPSCHNHVTILSQSCYHPVTILLPSCHNPVTVTISPEYELLGPTISPNFEGDLDVTHNILVLPDTSVGMRSESGTVIGWKVITEMVDTVHLSFWDRAAQHKFR